jgi:hypothetical protein
MLSAVGVPIRPDENPNEIPKPNNGRGPPKFVRKLAPKLWDWKISPFGVMRTLGRGFSKKMIKGYMNKRLNMLSEQEFKDMHEYLH